MTNEERANDMASRLFDAIAQRVDQFFKAKNIQGGVRRGDDLFSPMDKHELTKSLLLFADEIRAEAAEKVQKLAATVITKYPSEFERGISEAYVNAIAAITGKPIL